jgi:quercetin dioxygenase-like cupin family protein
MEVHPFDQIILVVQGNGQASLVGKIWKINQGDLIFIPRSVHHNIINLTPNNAPMKIISFYSSQDIPAKAIYPQEMHEPSQ